METLAEYAIVEELYRGMHTVVYRMQRGGDTVILKTHAMPNPPARWLANLRHEHEILQVLRDVEGVGQVRGLARHGARYGLVLEDVHALSLRTLLDRQSTSLRERLSIFTAVTRCLERIHTRGIIHKDINPKNILYAPGTEHTYLIDFGIASLLPREISARKGATGIEGTPAYIAPEQTGRLNRSVDHRADLYSLGVVLYELLAGSKPFASDDALELIHAHLARIPTAPGELVPEIPAALSNMAMRLLEKEPDNRYQSARGVLVDIEAVIRLLWAQNDHTAPMVLSNFTLGSADIPGQLPIPEKLYGRSVELEALSHMFLQTSQSQAALALVAGPSGIGKTSLVREIYRPIAQARGYVIAGKADVLRRNIPYAPLIQAFTDLVGQILTEPEHMLAKWRERLTAALGSHGQLMVDMLPELALIIGQKPPLRQLLPQEAKHRFNLTLLAFIGTFASPDHPLVMFLDDLQWADAATLEILHLLLTDSSVRHLLIIGAYRDSEVGQSHLLSVLLGKLHEAGAAVQTITVPPLGVGAVEELLADTLGTDIDAVHELAAFAYEKAGGNPFVLREFLTVLCEEKLIHHRLPDGKESDGEHESRGPGSGSRWSWDLKALHRSPTTQNMADLLVGRIARLEQAAKRALSLAACIGMRVSLGVVGAALGEPLDITARLLWQAVERDLLLLSASDQRLLTSLMRDSDLLEEEAVATIELWFRHDRIRQAAYALLADSELSAVHHHLGRVLLAYYPPPAHEEHLFDIVGHLNRAHERMHDPRERLELAYFNLSAGRKAAAAVAFDQAAEYLAAGMALLGENAWQEHYELTASLYKERAQAEISRGNVAACEGVITSALSRVSAPMERAALLLLQLRCSTLSSDYHKAVATGREALAALGLMLPASDELAECVRRDTAAIHALITERTVASLTALPKVQSSELDAQFSVLVAVQIASIFIDPNLAAWISIKMVSLCLEHGNSQWSSTAYAAYAVALCEKLGNRKGAFELAEVTVTIADEFQAIGPNLRALTMLASSVLLWGQPVGAIERFCREITAKAMESGEFEIACPAFSLQALYRYYAGQPLAELATFIEEGAAFGERLRSGLVRESFHILRQATECLMVERPLSTKPPFEQLDVSAPEFAHMALRNKSFFRCLQVQICYLMGDYETALRWAHDRVRYWSSDTNYPGADLRFYQTLATLALAERAPEHPLVSREFITQSLAKLAAWAELCPANFRHKYSLVRAEIARMEARYWDAAELYQQALSVVREHSLVQEEGLICERAGRFFLERGHTDLGLYRLAQARTAYAAWGARRKVAELSTEFVALLQNEASHDEAQVSTLASTTISDSRRTFDVASVIKASQALSSNLILDELYKRLLFLTLENAGATRGCLVQRRGDEWLLQGEAEIAKAPSFIRASMPLALADDKVPLSIVNYVRRVGEVIVLGDTGASMRFAADSYLRKHQPKSLLCAPLVSHSMTVGILYLENQHAHHAFSPARIEILQVLAAQAAISLENAQLYAELKELNTRLEARVEERTAELRATQAELIERAHQAGMAEIASNVLHNIGNVLTSLLTAAGTLQQQVRELSVDRLRRGTDLLEGSRGRLSTLLEGQRGELFIEYMAKLTDKFAHDQEELSREAASLCAHIEHIRTIIAQQESYAAGPRLLERVELDKVVEDTLAIHTAMLAAGHIEIRRHIDEVPAIVTDRYRVQQIIAHLVLNAIQALERSTAAHKVLRVRLYGCGPERVCVEITDNGIGIPAENLLRIFHQGFTTRPGGSGLGLHYAANAANDLGGSLRVHSDGVGTGATFHLELGSVGGAKSQAVQTYPAQVQEAASAARSSS